MFNDGNYWQRAQTPEFRQNILKDGHPSPPLADEPFCTRSQIIAYVDRYGNQVAIVHQYLRPDQTIGASGRPDPKELLYNLELYVVMDPE